MGSVRGDRLPLTKKKERCSRDLSTRHKIGQNSSINIWFDRWGNRKITYKFIKKL